MMKHDVLLREDRTARIGMLDAIVLIVIVPVVLAFFGPTVCTYSLRMSVINRV